jgi:diguanylate cyclase (GGDEF)-like protein/PAS domain S-box-containing protein
VNFGADGGQREKWGLQEVKQYRPHILVAFALAIALLSGLHHGLQNALTDFRFRWTPREATGDIVVIAIDPSSIERVGVWPWPRQIHAELIRKLDSVDVRDIVFDVDFSSPSNPDSDTAFAEALKAAGGSVVLPSFRQSMHGHGNGKAAPIHWNRPLAPFADNAWSAFVNVEIEGDGLVRRYPFGEKVDGQFMPSMGALLAGRSEMAAAPFWIDFGIRAASIPRVSYSDVLRGDADALQKIKARKVIVGSTALELGDQFVTPNGRVLAGPVLQALAAESMLQQRVMRSSSVLVSAFGVAIIALTMMLLWRRTSAGLRALTLVGIAFAVEGTGLLIQARFPLILDTSWFHIAILAYLATIALDEIDVRGLLSRIAERRFQRIAMSLGDGLVCTDQDFRITVWNPGAAAILGYQGEDMIGRSFDAVCAGPGDSAEGKPFSIRTLAQDLLRAPGGHVVEITGRRQNGEEFPLEACFSSWEGADGVQYGAILRDISVRKREAERIRFLAEHDALTGLPNRNTLHARLSLALHAGGAEQRDVGVLALTIDNLQQIHAMLGHAAGDLAVHAVSRVLAMEVCRDVTLSRTNGDEFVFLITGADARLRVEGLSQRISIAFQAPLQAGTRQHRIRISMGGAIYPRDGRSAEELLGNSHLALDHSRSTRHGQCVLFNRTLREDAEARLKLEAELVRAAEQNEFELFYQPQVRLKDGEVVGAEALIRWRHPDRGLIFPGEFMPIINSSPIFDKVATWIMRAACTQARRWEQTGHPLRVGVNLSPLQVQSGHLVDEVAAILAETELTPSLLELEVTEDILLADTDSVIATFHAIRRLGVRVVFDDFGTGYGNLSDLKIFSVDGLKIDRSFVQELVSDSADAAIVGTIVNLGNQLGLATIAEGIESRTSADLLMRMGCEEGQGYHFGRPVPVAEFNQKFLQDAGDAASIGRAVVAA